jgi:phage protein D
MPPTNEYAIDFKVKDNGSPVSDAVRKDIVQITVDDALDAAAVATVKVRDLGGVHSDGSKFKIGSELTIELGYVGATLEVFKGEITAWKGAFARRGGQTFTVVAQDKFHRLRRNRRQKTYLNMKDSAAIEQVVQGAGLTVEVEATPVTQDVVCQWNTTDADFVLQRAAAFGHEVLFDEGKVKVRKPKLDDAAAVTVKWHDRLKSFTAVLSLQGQQKDLKVSAWDMKQKQAVESTVATGKERSKMGGTVPGAQAADEGLSAGTTWLPRVDTAVTQAHVDAMAEGQFAARSEKFVTGEGSCEGEPKLRRGTVLQLEGIGNLLEGPYYVTRAIHTLLVGSGYTTTFRVKRTAVKAPAPPPQAQETQQEQTRPDPIALLDPDWQPPGGIVAELVVTPQDVQAGHGTTSPGVRTGLEGETPDVSPANTQTIRFKLEDQDGTPLSNKPFELVIAGVPPISGVTGPDGYVVADVPGDAQTGELTFWMEADKSGESYTWPLRISDHTA